MRRAIELATRSQGNNRPNPKVGAVLVYQNRIIGEGYHEQYGSAHAEVNAIATVSTSDRGFIPYSTLYVTLEPCFHYGKTPPCVQLVLDQKIQRVVIACKDPFPKVAGQSVALLREKGVDVNVGVLEQEASWMMRRFLTTVQKKRPYIVLKWAESQDGWIGKPDRQVPISNILTQYWTHQWRSEEAAILVGTNTAALDNPQLNNRLTFGSQPLRLVFDRHLRLLKGLNIFDQKSPTWVFTLATMVPTETAMLRYITVPTEANWLPWILHYLHQARVQSILVEGGAQILQAFIDAQLWDEARIWQGTAILSQGIAAPTLKHHQLRSSSKVLDNHLRIYQPFRGRDVMT